MITPVGIHEIDRTVYERLRLALVASGYLPNITSYSTETEYTNAKSAIHLSKGGVIEVMGVGAAESRDAKQSTKIVIDRKGADIGTIGGFPATQFEKVGDTFTKRNLPDTTMDLNYDIRVISNSVKFERIATEAILAAFGMRKYIPITVEYNQDSKDVILMNFKGDVDVSAAGMRERLFKYSAMDIWIKMYDDDVVRANIPPLTSVSFQVSISGLSGTEDSKETVLTVEI